jgi:hypothetical protein
VAAKPRGFGSDERRKETAMQKQRGSRRWLFGVLAAASAALGAGHGASAGDNAKPRPDYGSKELFRLECELLGGTFSEDGIGNTRCHIAGIGTVECDANGNDCWVTHESWQRPPGGENSYDGSVDEVATDAPPSVVVPDDQEPKVKAKHGKGKKRKKGKKHGHGGKRRT